MTARHWNREDPPARYPAVGVVLGTENRECTRLSIIVN